MIFLRLSVLKKINIYFLGLSCTFSIGVKAASFDLGPIVSSDPRVLSARATYKSKLVEAEGAWSAYFPVLRGIGSAGTSKSSDPLVRDGSKRTYGLELEQPIPIFGRESAKVELARVAARVEEAEVKRVEQVVIGELLETLVGVKSTGEMLVLREQLVANLDKQGKAAREAVLGGGLKVTEERQILSRRAQALALKAKAVADLVAAKARLSRLLPQASDLPALEKMDLRRWWPNSLELEAFERQAQLAAPPVLRAQAEAEQASAEHDVARADYWPKLSITLQGVKGTFGSASADSSSAFIGVSIPLFEGGATVSRVDSSASRVVAAKERAIQENNMALQRVAEAFARWQAADAMAAAFEDAEREETEGVALTEELLAGGGTTRFGLLKARQSLLETKLQTVDYRSQRSLAWIKLVQEAGALVLDGSSQASVKE